MITVAELVEHDYPGDGKRLYWPERPCPICHEPGQWYLDTTNRDGPPNQLYCEACNSPSAVIEAAVRALANGANDETSDEPIEAEGTSDPDGTAHEAERLEFQVQTVNRMRTRRAELKKRKRVMEAGSEALHPVPSGLHIGKQ